jgi:hypothetical protein
MLRMANRTLTAGAHKTPRRRRIPSYCDFATRTPINVLIMPPQLVTWQAHK